MFLPLKRGAYVFRIEKYVLWLRKNTRLNYTGFLMPICDVCHNLQNTRTLLKLIKPTDSMPVNEPIKVAIADDHKIFRDGIRMSLSGKDYLRIIWEAEDGKDLVHKMKIKLQL